MYYWSQHYTHRGQTGSNPEKAEWGQTHFQVNDDPEIGQRTAECDPEIGQSDLINGQIWRKLTKFSFNFDPKLSPTQMDPFPDQVDLCVLECIHCLEVPFIARRRKYFTVDGFRLDDARKTVVDPEGGGGQQAPPKNLIDCFFENPILYQKAQIAWQSIKP